MLSIFRYFTPTARVQAEDITAHLNRIEAKQDRLARALKTLMRYYLIKEEENSMELKDLAVQLAKDAKDNGDAFTALNAADEARAVRLKAEIDKLTAAGGVDQSIIDGLTAVHDTMTGTNGQMVAAAVLANTDAADDVPVAAAATVPDAPTS